MGGSTGNLQRVRAFLRVSRPPVILLRNRIVAFSFRGRMRWRARNVYLVTLQIAFKVNAAPKHSAANNLTIFGLWSGNRMISQVRLQDQGSVLDFDASDLQRQPPLDTTWHQVIVRCYTCAVCTLLSVRTVYR